jgi:hypothetical protein
VRLVSPFFRGVIAELGRTAERTRHGPMSMALEGEGIAHDKSRLEPVLVVYLYGCCIYTRS